MKKDGVGGGNTITGLNFETKANSKIICQTRPNSDCCTNCWNAKSNVLP